MNPRFKFRVWDIEDCTYFEPRDFDDLWLNENAELRVGFYSDATQMIEDYTDNVIIEQCTGLKDKNGNLIYEGDIIKDRGEIMYKIQWKDASFFAVAIDNFNYMPDSMLVQTWLNTWKAEIIGNIHERPEQKDIK